MITNEDLHLWALEDLYAQAVMKMEDLTDTTIGNYLYYHQDLVKYLLTPKKTPQIFWVTINPNSEAKFEDFKNVIEKIIKHTYIVNAVYTYEQRGKTVSTMGDGFHVHICFTKIKGVQPQKVIDNMYRLLRPMVGSKASIDVKVYPGEYRQDKITYLKGEKDDAEKSAAVEINKLWRKKYNLNALYEKA